MADLMRLLDLRALAVLALVFVPLERLAAWRPGQRLLRRGWWRDLLCYQLLNRPLVGVALAAAVAIAAALGHALVPGAWQDTVARQPLWLQVPVAIVLSDLGFYAAHRLFHAVPWLWRFHAVHHSIEEMDWLAAARVHPLDHLVTKGLSLLPVYALGFSTAAIGVYAAIYFWQSILIHSNVRLRFGPLRWVLASPEFHHWHHGNEPAAYNRNFAGQLPVLDLLFGTLHMPDGRMPERYGVGEVLPSTYAGQLAYPFRRTSRAERGPDGTPLRAPSSGQPG